MAPARDCAAAGHYSAVAVGGTRDKGAARGIYSFRAVIAAFTFRVLPLFAPRDLGIIRKARLGESDARGGKRGLRLSNP